MKIESKKFNFTNSEGITLSGSLEQSLTRPTRAFALFAHCFSCSKDIKAARNISKFLAERGIAVLRFDFTGLGSSEGDFANSHFAANVDDLRFAAKALEKEFEAPGLLIGHSLGGAAVLAVGGEIESVKGITTIGAPFDPAHVIHNIKGDLDKIIADGRGPVSIGGRKFEISAEFIQAAKNLDQKQKIANLKKALLVMHSPTDQIVGVENAGDIFSAAKHPKSFIGLDNIDHLVSGDTDALFVANTIATWAERYVVEQQVENRVEAEGQVYVAETLKGKFQQDIWSGEHHLIADEPLKVGGLNSGLAPYDFLMAGLGACTAMTVRMYADFKKIPLEKVSVDLSHSKEYAKDCADCEEDKGRKLDHIEREVSLEGPDLTVDQRARLLAIADKCPVHKTLHETVSISTVAKSRIG